MGTKSAGTECKEEANTARLVCCVESEDQEWLLF